MPINDLTIRPPDTTNLVRFGTINKGGEKKPNAPGPDLDHFRIEIDDAISLRYPWLAKAVSDLYGDEPKHLPVTFIGHTVDDVFPTWYEGWVKSGLQHRCDGVTQKHGVADSGKYETGLPCAKGDDADPSDPKTFACLGYDKKGQPVGCVRTGKLHVALPALWNEAGIYGKFVLKTGSIHDILELHGRLWAIYDLISVVMENPSLMMVPATLGRAERQISYPRDGKRQNRPANLLTLHENIHAMTRTHPLIAAKLQNVITASAGDKPLLGAGEPAGGANGLPSGDDKHQPMADFFGKVLEGITPSAVRLATKGLPEGASQPQIIAAVLDHWYEGDPEACATAAHALVKDELLNQVADALGHRGAATL